MAVILVADDDGHIREVVRFALEKAGHRVIEAADGTAALRCCAEEPVDVEPSELDPLRGVTRTRAGVPM